MGRVEGAGARDFLRYALANNVDRLQAPGKALYSCLLKPDGTVIDDLIVYFFRDPPRRVPQPTHSTPAARRAFIVDNTRLQSPPHTPELSLHLADEITPIWKLTEEALLEIGLPPPYWAFAWAGGQALARYVLDDPAIVAGKAVIDFHLVHNGQIKFIQNY